MRWISATSLLMRETNVAQSRAGVKARREALQVPVQVEPHVEEDLGRKPHVSASRPPR